MSKNKAHIASLFDDFGSLKLEAMRLYAAGKLEPGAMLVVENHLASDELDREAFEGIAKESSDAKVLEAVATLNQQVQNRIDKKGTSGSFRLFYQFAAAAAILLMVAWGFYRFIDQEIVGKNNNLAEAEKTEIGQDLPPAEPDPLVTTKSSEPKGDLNQQFAMDQDRGPEKNLEFRVSAPRDQSVTANQLARKEIDLVEANEEDLSIGISDDRSSNQREPLMSEVQKDVISAKPAPVKADPKPPAPPKTSPTPKKEVYFGYATEADSVAVSRSLAGNDPVSGNYMDSPGSRPDQRDRKSKEKVVLEDAIAYDEVSVLDEEMGMEGDDYSPNDLKKDRGEAEKNNRGIKAGKKTKADAEGRSRTTQEEENQEGNLGGIYKSGDKEDLSSGERNYAADAAIYEARLTENPDDEEVRFKLGICYLHLGKPGKAALEFSKVAANRQSPLYHAAKWNEALALIQKQDKTAAKSVLEEIIKEKGPTVEKAKAALKTLED